MREERARLAAALFAERRQRDLTFAGYADGLGEPAWDMLLLLYVRDAAGEPTTIEELLTSTGRDRNRSWPFIGWLKSQFLIDLAGIGDDPADVVTLKEEGRILMDAYLDRRDDGELGRRTH